MPSPRPLQYGQTYHIYNRGNNRENIFYEDRNYRYFLQLYARYIEPIAFTSCYCQLRNHFHVLVRIKTVDEQQAFHIDQQIEQPFKPRRPSQQFGNLFNAYAKAINKAYGRTGSLFEHPFRRVQVESDAHIVQLVAYIHRNPEKHGFVDDFRTWPYSSYQTLLSHKPTRLRREQVLDWFAGRQGFQSYHRRELNERPIGHLTLDDLT
jgi:REP element-mobilizing transposase RayT